MNDRLSLVGLLLAGVVLGGCVSGARLGTARWSQFHADGPSQGWMAVPSTAAVPLVPKWSVDVGPAGYSSPVIGPEGTVYITTAAGEIVAVNPDGTIKWRRALPEPRLMSSPAVTDEGHVYVISTRKIAGRFASTLHKLTPDGAFLWE